MTSEHIIAPPADQRPAEAEPGSATLVVAQRTTHAGTFPPPRRRDRDRPSRAALVAVDGTAALLSTLALPPTQRHFLFVMGFMALVAALHRSAGLYRWAVERYVLDEAPSVAGRVSLAWCVLAVAAANLPSIQQLSLRTIVAGCAVQGAGTLAGRALVHWRRRRDRARRPHAALLVGSEPEASRVAAALERHPRCGVRPVGIVSAERAPARPDREAPGLPVLTTEGELRRTVLQRGVRQAIVLGGATAPDHRPWLHTLSELGCDVWELDHQPASYVAADAHTLAGFRCRPLLAPASTGHPGKRALDVVVSAVMLVAALPLLVACALGLRLFEGPGVVFRQERVGKDGRPFTLLKFRTYRPADPIEAATRWSVADERRMPWFCRFLRRSSLDELPQLWNVFRGDMSLVGPRPERPYFVMKFSETYPGYARRHRMATGITGLAQVNGLRGDTSIEDRCRFDNAYIDNWSLWRDITILLRTAAEFVRPTGS